MPVIPVSNSSGFPNSKPRSVKIFSKTDVNSYVPIRFSKRSNTARTAPFVHRLIRNARNSFSSVKILQPSQKRLNHDAFLTGTTKELSTMPKTFVYTAITVKKQMPVEKSCSAALNVHPVQPATKPVRISKRNGAADLIRRLMYVMAVQ